VVGVTYSSYTGGIVAVQLDTASNAPAFIATHSGNKTAAIFIGDVSISGKLTVDGSLTVQAVNIKEIEKGIAMSLDAIGGLATQIQALQSRSSS
jgi:hypothetical protein